MESVKGFGKKIADAGKSGKNKIEEIRTKITKGSKTPPEDFRQVLWSSVLTFWKKLSEIYVESQYIGLFLTIRKMINIDIRPPLIIGDLKELSAKLLI